MQLLVVIWFISSAALALGVAVACDKLWDTFSTGPRLAPAQMKRSSGRHPSESARQEEKSA